MAKKTLRVRGTAGAWVRAGGAWGLAALCAGCGPRAGKTVAAAPQKLTEAYLYKQPCTEVVGRVPAALRAFGYDEFHGSSALVAESSWYDLKYEPGTRMRHVARAEALPGGCAVRIVKEIDKDGGRSQERDWPAELELIKTVDPEAGARIESGGRR